jgi:putative heme degradation protein
MGGAAALAALSLIGGIAVVRRDSVSAEPAGTPSTDSFRTACDHLDAARDALVLGDTAKADAEIVKADSWSGTAIEDTSGDERERALQFAAAVGDAVPYIGGERAAEDIQRAAEACGV